MYILTYFIICTTYSDIAIHFSIIFRFFYLLTIMLSTRYTDIRLSIKITSNLNNVIM